jgi:hypothetical protein
MLPGIAANLICVTHVILARKDWQYDPDWDGASQWSFRNPWIDISEARSHKQE